jgi:23S rRNA (cytosine1962-C5)-methyltransferase
MSYPLATLQKTKMANSAFKHPWIFSGALERRPDDVEHGAIINVAGPDGAIIGTGTYSAKSSIAVRLFAFENAVINADFLKARIKAADAARKLIGFGPETDTTGYRVVFGEADGLPGLVVDRYDDVLVIQLSTAGMDRLRDDVVTALVETFAPVAVYERSDIAVRKEEGLHDEVGLRFGTLPAEVSFTERGMRFVVDVASGQKTGFFLDQKDLRAAVAKYAKGRNVLNLFSYSGATGVAAMRGGAADVVNVDSSAAALAACGKHAELNGIAPESFTAVETDAFQYLSDKDGERFDMIVLDPPALIKNRKDAEEGKKAYHFLNRAALRLADDGAIFVTSSCSHFLPEEDLAFILRRASVQAGVELQILETVRQSPDHPLSVYFPESAYLKSFVCLVRRRKDA